MKTYYMSINSRLPKVEVTVKNGAKFERDIIQGNYAVHTIRLNDHDANLVRKFAVKYGSDKSSNKGNWYAHCNGFSMGLLVQKYSDGTYGYIVNTYRDYGKSYPQS